MNLVKHKFFPMSIVKGRIEEFYDDWLANGKHEYTDAGNMKPVPRRLVVEWVIKSWQDIFKKTLAKSMKSCDLILAIDGTQDDLVSCFKKGKNVQHEKLY